MLEIYELYMFLCLSVCNSHHRGRRRVQGVMSRGGEAGRRKRKVEMSTAAQRKFKMKTGEIKEKGT